MNGIRDSERVCIVKNWLRREGMQLTHTNTNMGGARIMQNSKLISQGIKIQTTTQ